MACTYILGYWVVPTNIKHDLQHYKKYIPKTFFKLRNKHIVFFYGDDHILEYVKKCLKTPFFFPIKIKIKELPTYDISLDYFNSCKAQDINNLKNINNIKEKGLIHYRREYLGSGKVAYRSLITIWTSKLFLIQNVIDLNIFNTNIFAWTDAGISKMKKIHIDKINYNMDKINANDSNKKYKGEQLYNAAGFMISGTNTWLRIIELYKQKLYELKDSKYAHDEETILYLIYKENNELFNNVL